MIESIICRRTDNLRGHTELKMLFLTWDTDTERAISYDNILCYSDHDEPL